MRLLNLIILTLMALNLGCKSEDPTPELRDPIYNDLNKLYRDTEDSLKKSRDAVKTLEKDYESLEVRTIDRKTVQKELLAEKEKIAKLEQEAEYYRIAILKRKAEATISYKKAFSADTPWPDPKEYESYQLDKKMQSAPRNWGHRIPKLTNPLSKDQKEGSGAESAE